MAGSTRHGFAGDRDRNGANATPGGSKGTAPTILGHEVHLALPGTAPDPVPVPRASSSTATGQLPRPVTGTGRSHLAPQRRLSSAAVVVSAAVLSFLAVIAIVRLREARSPQPASVSMPPAAAPPPIPIVPAAPRPHDARVSQVPLPARKRISRGLAPKRPPAPKATIRDPYADPDGPLPSRL